MMLQQPFGFVSRRGWGSACEQGMLRKVFVRKWRRDVFSLRMLVAFRAFGQWHKPVKGFIHPFLVTFAAHTIFQRKKGKKTREGSRAPETPRFKRRAFAQVLCAE
jgi:hypothetical protein